LLVHLPWGIKDRIGSYTGGLMLLAALGIVAMAMVLVLGHEEANSRSRTRAANQT